MASATKPPAFTTKQRVLLALTAPLVPLFFCVASGVAAMRQDNPAFHQHPESMPQLRDLALAAVITAVLVTLRTLAVAVFSPLARLALPPATRCSAFRVDRFATSMFKLLYFSIMTVVGFWIQRGAPWFPQLLGGTGHASVSFEAVKMPPSQALRIYMLWQLAYQTHSLVFVLFCKPFDADTMDFVTHDLTGMLLIGSAYLVNYNALGSAVAFLNDACDAIQYAFFMATDSRRKAAIVPMYAVFMAGWWYTRLFVFPREYIYLLVMDSWKLDPHVSMGYLLPTTAMLGLLLALQAYWYFLFAAKGWRVLRVASKLDHAWAKKIADRS